MSERCICPSVGAYCTAHVNPAVCCGPCGKKAGDGTMPSYMYLSDGRAVCYECGDEAIRKAFPATRRPDEGGK